MDPMEQLIDSDPALRALRAAAAASLPGDPAHDMHHLLRVAAWTLRIGGPEVSPREAAAAALLHDFVAVEKNSPHRAKASELSAAAAAPLLAEQGFPPDAVIRITDAIRDHSFSRGAIPATPLGRALQDADRLDSLGALGIFRVVATATRISSGWFHPTDPWAADRPLNDRAFLVDHFFAKLLKLPETMQTEAGREEALRRVALMRSFLTQLGTEIGIPLES